MAVLVACEPLSTTKGEQRDHTLQQTALVNEVYFRLVGANHELKVASRKKFFAAAAEAMRHILIDAARH